MSVQLLHQLSSSIEISGFQRQASVRPKGRGWACILLQAKLVLVLGLLSSCTIMPGLENPNTSSMRKLVPPSHPQIVPTLIPITPALIHDQRISNYTYHIAPADVLNVSVWQHAELSPKGLALNQSNAPSTQGAAGQEGYLVNSTGRIYFPLVGSIKVANKTVDEVRRELTQRLKRYLKNPQLNVRVVDFRGRKVYVVGEVLKPGFIPINDQPLSITDALVLTGGLDPNAADPSHIYVIRGRIERPEVYWLNAKTPEALLLAEHFHLQPGDVLYVSSAAATRWNRVINQLLPSIQTIWYTKAIIDTN